MIFNDLLARSMRLINVLAAGATPSSDETQDGFLAVNDLLDSWNTERLNIPYTARASYALTSGTDTYQIGPGAASPGFAAPRPLKIESAGITVANPGGAGVLRSPLTLLSGAEYAVIYEKGIAGTSPTGLYYDHNWPIGTIYLTPVPTWTSNARSLELWTWNALAQFPDFVTDVPLAPGYARALQTALAIELAPQYGATISDQLAANAAEAKASIRALNAALPGAEPESAPLDATPAQNQ